jgi:hypothetical protein
MRRLQVIIIVPPPSRMNIPPIHERMKAVVDFSASDIPKLTISIFRGKG